MQFKYPEILYTLFLLVIPILIHLFQLRKFQKTAFTNVAFLKNVTIQTRKSSQLKKWLILLIRLLLYAAIILAFSEPYRSQNNDLARPVETVLYLDNSFSMQARGTQGELLKRAIQDILASDYIDNDLVIFTNNATYKNKKSKTLKNELLQIDYSYNQLDYNAALLKGKSLFSRNNKSLKNLIFISDFQELRQAFRIDLDSSINLHLVQLEAQKLTNVSIDTTYISKINSSNIELTVKLSGLSESTTDIPISLYDQNKLLAKSVVNDLETQSATFSVSKNLPINGIVTIEDSSLQYDNTLYFNINNRSKIKVLVINDGDADFLKRIYTEDEFIFQKVSSKNLNFNTIPEQNILVLNELSSISLSLSNALKNFVNNGGYIVLIPSENIDISSYNRSLRDIADISFINKISLPKSLTFINYKHSLFDNVFNEEISNFQYPFVNEYYRLNTFDDFILNLDNGQPFLVQSKNTFIFTAALNSNNSNFKNSPLIVPSFYNFGKESLKLPKLYFDIGEENKFDISTITEPDAILKLKLKDIDIIPRQQVLAKKVNISTQDIPEKSGTYAVTKESDTLEWISFNYNRLESELRFLKLPLNPNVTVNNSLPELLNNIKSDHKIHALWKWFIIFALLFLVLEILVLKYFK